MHAGKDQKRKTPSLTSKYWPRLRSRAEAKLMSTHLRAIRWHCQAGRHASVSRVAATRHDEEHLQHTHSTHCALTTPVELLCREPSLYWPSTLSCCGHCAEHSVLLAGLCRTGHQAFTVHSSQHYAPALALDALITTSCALTPAGALQTRPSLCTHHYTTPLP
eukprot:1160592-Pelagomonas_calceolata.AAC.1